MILPSSPTAPLVLASLTAVAYAVPAVARLPVVASRAAVLLAWLLHGLLLGWLLLGEPPRFGFASALSVTVWLVAAVYAIETQLYPQLQARWALSVMGAGAVLLAWYYPGQPLHTSASAWLPLPWALGTPPSSKLTAPSGTLPSLSPMHPCVAGCVAGLDPCVGSA
ncbi:MAG: hypothetical protein ACK5PE_00305, partial [bacterium]